MYQLPHAGIQSCLGCVIVFLKKSVLESELYREEVCQQLTNSHLFLKEYLKTIDRFFVHCFEGIFPEASFLNYAAYVVIYP